MRNFNTVRPGFAAMLGFKYVVNQITVRPTLSARINAVTDVAYSNKTRTREVVVIFQA